ncbi:hypothetical protein ACFQ07_22605, partial [Actinomadura adrarensis]
MDDANRSSRLSPQVEDTPEDLAERDQQEFEESLRQPPEVVPLAEVDPRIGAVAAAPPTSDDLLRLHRQAGTRDRPDLAYDSERRVNPLANQIARDMAAGEGAAPEDTAVETRGQRLARRTNQLLNHAGKYGAPVPESDSLTERIQHGLGQGAALVLLCYLPGTTRFLRSRLGRAVTAPLVGSRLGQKIPRATWDAFLARKDSDRVRAGWRGSAKTGTAEPGKGAGGGRG